MATSTFDRRIEITNSESVKKLLTIMAKEPPKDPISRHPYTEVEREKSNRLIRRCLMRSRQTT